MDIYVNDKLTEVENDISILSLLKSLNIESFKGIAIGLNDQVISKDKWNSTFLTESDKILLIRASQGG